MKLKLVGLRALTDLLKSHVGLKLECRPRPKSIL